MYYNIGIVRKNISNKYLYELDDILDIGQLVIINFNKKKIIGVVLEVITTSNYNGIIKKISEVLTYSIPKEYIKFIELFSQHNLIPLGTALQLIIPFSTENINKSPRKLKNIQPNENKNVVLNTEQQNAVDNI